MEVSSYNPYQLADLNASSSGILDTIIQTAPIRWLASGIRNIYSTVVLRGLARLYIFGPSVAGVGFWQGRDPANICSRMTESSEHFWHLNMEECHRIIATHFHSYVVLLEVLVYFILLVKVLAWGKSKMAECCHRQARVTKRPLVSSSIRDPSSRLSPASKKDKVSSRDERTVK